ncbi:MAG TPA: hypothetical protein VM366_01180 [Anaerolineae bacterium]|nr:hypothetical protein [Anaerolineae bacterium]
MAILSAVLVLVIAGCGLTLEQAVLEEAMRLGEGWTQTPVDSSTVQVLQAVAMEGRTIAVVGLARVEKDVQRSECVFVYEAVRTRLRWKTGGGGGGCGPGARLGLPLWIGSGQNSSVNADAWSRVYGVAYADEIVRAEVGWEDGLVQDVEVVHGSVLAVREGTHRYEQVRGLDAQSHVVYVHEQPGVSPGKQEP